MSGHQSCQHLCSCEQYQSLLRQHRMHTWKAAAWSLRETSRVQNCYLPHCLWHRRTPTPTNHRAWESLPQPNLSDSVCSCSLSTP